MKVEIINSGSKGNCAVIDDTLIIDAGWNCSPNGKCVLLTHQHTDHTKHLNNMQGLPIYAIESTISALRGKFPFMPFNEIKLSDGVHKPFSIINGGVEYGVIPWEVKHDVKCVGYEIIKRDVEEKRIFFATDFCEIVNEEAFIRNLRNKVWDALYIEGNNTLDATDFVDVYFGETMPKDEFHRRKSFQNHCGIDYLIHLFTKAGYSEHNRFTEPVMLLHKSSYYYQQNVKRIADLCKIANIINPLY